MSTAPSVTQRSLFGFLGNLPIKAKVTAGFAVVIALLAAVGGVGYNSLITVSHSLAELRHTTEIAGAAERIEVELIQMRRYAREYALTGEGAAAEEFETWAEKLDEALVEEKTLVGDDPLGQHMGEMMTELAAYRAGFERLHELRTERGA